jgi:O-methyltransferase
MYIFRNIIIKIINQFIYFLSGHKLYRPIIIKRLEFQNEPHIDKDFLKICKKLKKIYKKNCIEETNYTAYRSIKNIVNKNIKGAIVECGVFKGEKISFFIETLKLLKCYNRKIYLVDTFEGMTKPSSLDFQVITGRRMSEKDMFCSLLDVKKNISLSNYPKKKIKFLKIDVRETNLLKKNIPNSIAILRLDVDFYDATLSTLKALYYKVSKYGYIIHDDYGHWKGHFMAFNKFFNDKKTEIIRTCRKELIQIKN